VQAAAPSLPAVADAGRTGQDEDGDRGTFAHEVDVGGHAVLEGAVARARDIETASAPGERGDGSAPRLQPVPDEDGIVAEHARGQMSTAEAALVVAGHLPGHEAGQAARPEDQAQEQAHDRND